MPTASKVLLINGVNSGISQPVVNNNNTDVTTQQVQISAAQPDDSEKGESSKKGLRSRQLDADEYSDEYSDVKPPPLKKGHHSPQEYWTEVSN